MKHRYTPKGTCSRLFEIETDDNLIIQDIRIVGGCDGNLKGIAALLKGMSCQDAAERMEGIKCGFKKTSCPDQISIALREMIAKAEG
ncbi:MAG: TIGR03905 family TSCPD domain-containing protein [Clostridia bacterium]|nr:TIGR03905 family TSCPD domain-containing protein [Clostridia bacterium]